MLSLFFFLEALLSFEKLARSKRSPLQLKQQQSFLTWIYTWSVPRKHNKYWGTRSRFWKLKNRQKVNEKQEVFEKPTIALINWKWTNLHHWKPNKPGQRTLPLLQKRRHICAQNLHFFWHQSSCSPSIPKAQEAQTKPRARLFKPALRIIPG